MATPFKFTVTTTAANTTVFYNVFAYNIGTSTKINFDVDWGDGSGTQNILSTASNINHLYAVANTYTITVTTTGDLEFSASSNAGTRTLATVVTEWGSQLIKKLSFELFTNITFNLGAATYTIPNFQTGASLHNCFASCSNFNTNLNSWDMSNVTTASGMFAFATNFNNGSTTDDGTHPLTWGENTSGFTTINNIFRNATKFNQDVSGWNLSSCTNAAQAFDTASIFNNGDITNAMTKPLIGWERPGPPSSTMANITTIDSIFNACPKFNQNVSGWNLSACTSLNNAFKSCSIFNNGDVVDGTTNSLTWTTTSTLTSVVAMFFSCSQYKQNLTLNTDGVQDFSSMFISAVKFNGTLTNSSLGEFVTSAATNLTDMFNNAKIFNGSVGSWDVSNVTNFIRTFRATDVFNIDISSWNMSSALNLNAMFENAIAFNQPIGNWERTTPTVSTLVNVSNFSAMFKSATVFNQDITVWNVGGAINMSSMFQSASAFNNGDATDAGTKTLNTWNVSGVLNFSTMFQSAIKFNQDITSWNVGAATDMSSMFNSASIFNNGDLANNGSKPLTTWNVSNVVNFSSMFKSALKFNQDITNWNVSSATNMGFMFQGSPTLPTIFNNGDIGNNGNKPLTSWAAAMNGVLTITSMFQSATSFNQEITGWDISTVTNMVDLFNGAYLFNNGQTTNLGTKPLTWNTPNDTLGITSMLRVFKDARSFNQDISSWNVSDVTNFNEMFYSFTTPITSVFNQPIGSWNVSSGTTFGQMFNNAISFNQDLSSWNVSSSNNLSSMFKGAISFNNGEAFTAVTATNPGSNGTRPLAWTIGISCNMDSFLINASNFSQDISGINMENVINVSGMLSNSGLSVENYNLFLDALASNPSLPSGLGFGGQNLHYTKETSRNNIVTNKGWTFISDYRYLGGFQSITMFYDDTPTYDIDTNLMNYYNSVGLTILTLGNLTITPTPTTHTYVKGSSVFQPTSPVPGVIRTYNFVIDDNTTSDTISGYNFDIVVVFTPALIKAENVDVTDGHTYDITTTTNYNTVTSGFTGTTFTIISTNPTPFSITVPTVGNLTAAAQSILDGSGSLVVRIDDGGSANYTTFRYDFTYVPVFTFVNQSQLYHVATNDKFPVDTFIQDTFTAQSRVVTFGDLTIESVPVEPGPNLTYSGGEYTLINHPDGYKALVYTINVKVTSSGYTAGTFTLTVTYAPLATILANLGVIDMTLSSTQNLLSYLESIHGPGGFIVASSTQDGNFPTGWSITGSSTVINITATGIVVDPSPPDTVVTFLSTGDIEQTVTISYSFLTTLPLIPPAIFTSCSALCVFNGDAYIYDQLHTGGTQGGTRTFDTTDFYLEATDSPEVEGPLTYTEPNLSLPPKPDGYPDIVFTVTIKDDATSTTIGTFQLTVQYPDLDSDPIPLQIIDNTLKASFNLSTYNTLIGKTVNIYSFNNPPPGWTVQTTGGTTPGLVEIAAGGDLTSSGTNIYVAGTATDGTNIRYTISYEYRTVFPTFDDPITYNPGNPTYNVQSAFETVYGNGNGDGITTRVYDYNDLTVDITGQTYTGDPFTIPSASATVIQYTVTLNTGNPNPPVSTFTFTVTYPSTVPPTIVTFDFDSTKTETIDLSTYFPTGTSFTLTTAGQSGVPFNSFSINPISGILTVSPLNITALTGTYGDGVGEETIVHVEANDGGTGSHEYHLTGSYAPTLAISSINVVPTTEPYDLLGAVNTTLTDNNQTVNPSAITITATPPLTYNSGTGELTIPPPVNLEVNIYETDIDIGGTVFGLQINSVPVMELPKIEFRATVYKGVNQTNSNEYMFNDFNINDEILHTYILRMYRNIIIKSDGIDIGDCVPPIYENLFVDRITGTIRSSDDLKDTLTANLSTFAKKKIVRDVVDDTFLTFVNLFKSMFSPEFDPEYFITNGETQRRFNVNTDSYSIEIKF